MSSTKSAELESRTVLRSFETTIKFRNSLKLPTDDGRLNRIIFPKMDGYFFNEESWWHADWPAKSLI